VVSQSRSGRGNPIVVDLFSGPGGLSLGFQHAGFTIGVGVERDHSSAQTYRENFPKAIVIEDEVGSIDASEILDSIDRAFPRRNGIILIGGPPCQPFSNANMHLDTKGNGHPSYNAIEVFVKLLEDLQPDAFLFENVTSFEALRQRERLIAFIGKIQRLGLTPASTKLEAYNYGVPQHRRRLFIGSIKGSEHFALPLPEPSVRILNHLSRQDDVCVKNAISDLPMLPIGGGGTDVSEHRHAKSKSLCSYQRMARRGAVKLFNHWSTSHSKPVMETIRQIPPGLSLVRVWNRLPLRIKKRYANRNNIQFNIYRRLSWKGISPTVVHPRRAMLLHPSQTRIISVREAARLQGFPDAFRFHGGIDSQYQQVANAVPPPMARFLGLHFLRHLQNLGPRNLEIQRQAQLSDSDDMIDGDTTRAVL
jgi:DNA (cytosine-5)-methyltransferase 1